MKLFARKVQLSVAATFAIVLGTTVASAGDERYIGTPTYIVLENTEALTAFAPVASTLSSSLRLDISGCNPATVQSVQVLGTDGLDHFFSFDGNQWVSPTQVEFSQIAFVVAAPGVGGTIRCAIDVYDTDN
jgi:hypothetical protein